MAIHNKLLQKIRGVSCIGKSHECHNDDARGEVEKQRGDVFGT